MSKVMEMLGACLTIFVMVIGLSALFALPVMWLWNDMVTQVFGLKSLTFFQAWELNILCGLLFAKSSASD